MSPVVVANDDGLHRGTFRNVDEKEEKRNTLTGSSPEKAEEDPHSFHSCLSDLWNCLVLHQVLVLLPTMAFIGLENSFWAGEFPQLLPEDSIGIVLACVGMTEIVVGLLSGRLQSCLGAKGLYALGAVSFGTGLCLTVLLREGLFINPSYGGVPLIAFIAAACFGIGDCAIQVVILAQLGRLSGDLHLFDKGTAFVAFQSVNTAFTAGPFFWGPAIPFHGDGSNAAQAEILAILLLIATLCFMTQPASHTAVEVQVP